MTFVRSYYGTTNQDFHIRDTSIPIGDSHNHSILCFWHRSRHISTGWTSSNSVREKPITVGDMQRLAELLKKYPETSENIKQFVKKLVLWWVLK
jgi:hypothetical protein